MGFRGLVDINRCSLVDTPEVLSIHCHGCIHRFPRSLSGSVDWLQYCMLVDGRLACVHNESIQPSIVYKPPGIRWVL